MILIDTTGSIDTSGSIETIAPFRERNLNGHFGNAHLGVTDSQVGVTDSQVGVTDSQVGVTDSPLRETNLMDLDLYPERPATA